MTHCMRAVQRRLHDYERIDCGSTSGWYGQVVAATFRDYFRALDALRGPAALCIATFHFYDQWAGYLAVEFFFVLSGFLLAHQFVSRLRSVSVGLYLARRLVRLYPMHLYGLLTYGLAAWVLAGRVPSYPDGTLATLAQQLTLTHGIGLSPHGLTWNYPSWAVSVEFWVGFIVFFLLVKRVTIRSLICMALMSFGILMWKNGSLATNFTNYFGYVNSGLLRGFGSFVIGVLAYRIYQCFGVRPLSRACFTWLELACVAGVVFLIASRSTAVSQLDFLAPVAFMASTIVYACEGGYVSELLCRFNGMGTVSYSIYLNQATMLLCLTPLWELVDPPMLVGLSIYLALLIGYSYGTNRWIERPARKKGLTIIDSFTRRWTSK